MRILAFFKFSVEYEVEIRKAGEVGVLCQGFRWFDDKVTAIGLGYPKKGGQ